MFKSIYFTITFILPYLNLFQSTISHSINNYDNYIFSRSWIPSFCKFNNQSICHNNSNNYTKFTIHGLWPTYSNHSWPQFCTQEPIDKKRVQSIIPEMIHQWTDNNDTSWKLWNHEWNKHGTCSLGNLYIDNSNDYFTAALWINMRLNSQYQLDYYGITASNTQSYRKSTLETVFNAGVVCKKDHDKYLLTELRNVISLNFSMIEPANDDDSCGDDIYLIASPS